MNQTSIFHLKADIINFGGHSCTIIEKGAEIQELIFNMDTCPISVIEGYANQDALEKHKGSRSAILLPFPNRLSNGLYTFENQNFVFPVDEPMCQNRLHGFHKALDYKKINQGEYSYHYKKEFEYYPFEFQTFAKYYFEDNTFHFEFSVQAACSMPIALGWHPYFKLPSNLEHWTIQLPSCKKIEVNKNKIPTGKKSAVESRFCLKNFELDACFEIDIAENKYVILEDENYILEISWEDPHRFVQLYIPPERNCIAIEPMTGNINCFQTNEGLSCLQTGENLVLKGKINCIGKK